MDATGRVILRARPNHLCTHAAGITYRGGLAAIDAVFEQEGGDAAHVQLTLFGSR